VDKYPLAWGIKTITLIFVMGVIDFGYHFAVSVQIGDDTKEEIADIYHRIIRR
jgi:hypothetical protein